MTTRTPDEQRDEQASARREAAKRLHPDRGGDPVEFDRVMKSFETADRTVAEVRVRRTGGAIKALRTTSKAVVADVRRRLPRSFPGSRRYGRL